ncbi:aminopeptidase N [Ectothiorhodospiraceae bacterium WFHF3C12]|nr:aminopeptidase N [Ectothiorhodospiraceae bacterium WFHF3C12]
MAEKKPVTIHRHDYQPPDYRVERVDLRFELGEEETLVTATLDVRRNYADEQRSRPLHLNGVALDLRDVRIDGEALALDEYLLSDEGLSIEQVPHSFELTTTVAIHPEKNTELQGLYRSGGMFCTQCEAEGFRRITFFPDRPDVMARYRTTIIAEQARYPVLLSNGNPVDSGTLDDGRHWITWDDPFPKPSYLFALVAGDLACNEDSHVTASGREIALRIYTEKENVGKTGHAMASLKAAMAWDEATYGLECDLDTYLVVAVGDFNMGAMENKGLNIFNTQYILARPDSATDRDFENIQDVVGHEYFHNWTGNRVTLRDWFQLSLKEGLTVFREQQFSADMGAPAVKRIDQVRGLRAAQFPEDASPMAHPVRPDSYVEINNFYTATVYMKGAEVIRMYQQLLGQEGFRRGMDLYIQRHDGQAVTCDDFLSAMADANDRDLTQFGLWYSQAGTPEVSVRADFDAAAGAYVLRVSQSCPATPGQPHKQPFHIPLEIALLDANGDELTARLDTDGEPPMPGPRLLELRESEQTFRFTGLSAEPIPSLLRGFSAPVKLDYPYTEDDLAFLFAHESDPFNRWEAGQRLTSGVLLDWVRSGPGELPEKIATAFGNTLNDDALDPALIAEALVLPTETHLAEQTEVIDVAAIHSARESMRRQLAERLYDQWTETYRVCARSEPGDASEAMAQRRLKNLCLDYLMSTEREEIVAQADAQFQRADNMTDSIAALSLLADTRSDAAERALGAFYERWMDDPLVVDKWFRVQAMSRREDTLERVKTLTGHPAFDRTNPNRLRAVYGAFSQGNPVRFHDPSGEGYRLIADCVIELDARNAQLAARLVTPLTRWRRYDKAHAPLMKAELERIFRQPSLSNDVYEVVSKSLDQAGE